MPFLINPLICRVNNRMCSIAATGHIMYTSFSCSLSLFWACLLPSLLLNVAGLYSASSVALTRHSLHLQPVQLNIRIIGHVPLPTLPHLKFLIRLRSRHLQEVFKCLLHQHLTCYHQHPTLWFNDLLHSSNQTSFSYHRL